jgi:hypothetical protein
MHVLCQRRGGIIAAPYQYVIIEGYVDDGRAPGGGAGGRPADERAHFCEYVDARDGDAAEIILGMEPRRSSEGRTAGARLTKVGGQIESVYADDGS